MVVREVGNKTRRTGGFYFTHRVHMPSKTLNRPQKVINIQSLTMPGGWYKIRKDGDRGGHTQVHKNRGRTGTATPATIESSIKN